ncbi:hypothetical protein Rs2_04385 [Raphanus sativus]|nr:hypothetical protein Rs2_04385 [Raphanus sativus]
MASNWLPVSPSKVGRSPVKETHNQSGTLHISVSKFSVLSVDEEQEEGEINDLIVQPPDTEIQPARNKNVERDMVDSEAPSDAQLVVQTSRSHEKEKQCVEGDSREANEKKAKSQNASSVAMSTRSSRRHH